ncbi:MAG: cation transporter [Gallionella sp.]
MSAHCHDDNCEPATANTPRYRRVLWVALIINAVMFLVEIWGGSLASSTSLLADSVDFMGDAANYGISLLVLSMGITWRARAAMLKGLSMGAFGVLVLAKVTWDFFHGTMPAPLTMSLIALLALMANVTVAVLLYAYREGDANMRSVWLCSRNDAIGNLAVMLAAFGVFITGSSWPDLFVAVAMASLALSSSVSVIRQAQRELQTR